jgi:glycosyltransferase involved in cell wall biosynthesis
MPMNRDGLLSLAPRDVVRETLDATALRRRAAERDWQRVKVAYIVGSLQDAGAERRTLELLKHLDRERFAPSLILMEQTGVERAQGCAEQCFVMGVPEAGNTRWLGRSLSLAGAVWRTRAQLVKWRTHVVHAMLPASSIVGGAAARLARVPVLVGSRPCLVSLYRSGNRVVSLADKMAFRMAHVNLGNSIAVSREMIALGGCPPEKCHTIHNGVDTRRFHPGISQYWRAEMGWNNQNVVFGMVANFRAYKRHIDLVEAADMIGQRFPEARFILAGADFGSQRSVMARVRELGLEDKVRVVESDSSPEKILAALDVYVCASESEGFSNVILEAMACGKPVIATNVGGNPEAVKDGITGFLVPYGSPQAIAGAASMLLNDPAQRRSMGTMGRRRVEQEFSLERMVRLHEQLYLQLFSEWRRTTP